MLEASCHLHRIEQFKVSNGTLISMLTVKNEGDATSWEDHLYGSELVFNIFFIFSSSMTPLVNSLPLGSFLKNRGLMCLKCLLLSLCVPHLREP